MWVRGPQHQRAGGGGAAPHREGQRRAAQADLEKMIRDRSLDVALSANM
jgi:hypothetical protein